MPYMKRPLPSDGGISRCPAAVGDESKDLPPGPRDLAEVMKFMEHTVQQVLECPQRRQRLELWCQRHFEMNSDFSGIMCFEDCFRWHIMVTAKLLGLSCPPVESYRACDMDVLSQSVLARREVLRPKVLLANIMDRIPSHARDVMESFVRSHDLSLPQQVVEQGHMKFLKAVAAAPLEFSRLACRG